MEAESRRLYVQLTQLLADTDVFDFLCDHTFALLDVHKAGFLRLSQVASLIENFQAAKTSAPCTAEEVNSIWQSAADPASRTMPIERFREFVRQLFQDFLALYEQATNAEEQHDEGVWCEAPVDYHEDPVDYHEDPPTHEDDEDLCSILTDATDLTMLAKEARRLSPQKMQRRPPVQRSASKAKAPPLHSSFAKAPRLSSSRPKSATSASSSFAKPSGAKAKPALATAVPQSRTTDSATSTTPAPKTSVPTITATPKMHNVELVGKAVPGIRRAEDAARSSDAPTSKQPVAARPKTNPASPLVAPYPPVSNAATPSLSTTATCAASSEVIMKQASASRSGKSWSAFAPEDFYAGNRSILMSEDAALRFAREFGEGFEDMDFGPTEKDPLGLLALGFEIDCTWRRVEAGEVAPRFPICPGGLADSWFLSALALVMNSALLENLWPRGLREFGARGLYCFRFCKHFNRPVYVIVDNALPFAQDKPITAQGVWVALAEKAFAKLHGSYAQLWSGFIDEGIEDITGYPCMKFPMSKTFHQDVPASAICEHSGEMRFVHVEGRHLGVSAGLINTGILRNFLYPVKHVEGNVTFLNPWSDGGWLGDLSETFSMKLEECAHVFTHVFPMQSLHTLRRQRFEYVWTQATCGGTPIPARQPVPSTPESWLRNPRFRLEVDEPHDVMVCLSQRDPRLHGDRFPFSSSLEEIFILCMRDNGEPVAFDKTRIVKPSGMSSLSVRRQVLLHMRLDVGHYLLVPSTWAVGISKPFALTVYSSKSAKLWPPDD
eukprot:GEMP01001924.1.p1 GENE.GEMP01001924.1~~GEMP01001924.1.p1  ORF type:complete len:778 (+),score=171.58 GEMP01001924.1:2244-4577(+)